MTAKILNNIDHKDLKIDIRPGKDYGDFVNRALVFTTEYVDLQKEYPILIYKDADTEQLTAHAILGLEKDENLFIEDGEWQSQFIPATLARGPFSIGYHKVEENDGSETTEIVIMVDEENPRCGASDGEPVFLDYGGETPYLEHVKKALQKIEDGLQSDQIFFDLLKEFDLLEPVSINVTLSKEKQIGFNGYHTINKAKLAELDGESLQKLNRAGVMGLIYWLISSLGNFQRLITLKNARPPAS